MVLQVAASAAALFMFEVLLSVVLSFLFDAQFTYLVIGIAMIGISAGGVFLAVRKQTRPLFSNGALILGFSILILFFLIYWVSLQINSEVAKSLSVGGKDAAIATIFAMSAKWTLIVGAAAAVPFFIFSVIVGQALQNAEPDHIPRIYALELACGALGCVAAALAIRFGSYSTCVMFIIGLCLVPLVIERRPLYLMLSLTLAAVTALGLRFDMLEPRPQLDIIARNYDLQFKVKELWHDWTTYSRVGYVELQKPDSMYVMVLGNGEGHAYARPYHAGEFDDITDSFTPFFIAANKPATSLVLFAGMGRDLLDLYSINKGVGDFTGVELNPKLVKRGLEDKTLNLRSFFDLSNVHFEVAEARAYLESSKKKFDLIVLSWSGTTIAYYTGGIGHTTQFMYTKEAMESVIDHLGPNGMFVVLNANKVNLLATLRTIFEFREQKNLAEAVIVANRPDGMNDWRSSGDENFIMVKPSGFTGQELDRIEKSAAENGIKIVYSWRTPPDSVTPYSQTIHSENLHSTLRTLGETAHRHFSISTDDWPFALRMESYDWNSLDSWRWHFRNFLSFRLSEWYPEPYIILLIGLGLLTTFGPLILSPVMWRDRRALPQAINFLFIGLGFMFVESGLIHCSALALETAGWTTAIGVGGLILATGMGSILSLHLRIKNAEILSLLLLIGILLLAANYHGSFVRWTLQWPFPIRAMLIITMIFPFGLLIGQQFGPALRSLARQNADFIPWAWAFNGVGGTIAGLCAPHLAQANGFAFLLKCGAASYTIVLIFTLALFFIKPAVRTAH